MTTEAMPLTWHEGRLDATPEEVGMDASRLNLLDTHYARLIEVGKLQAASYLVARHGRIVAFRSAGKLTHKPDSPPLMPDSIRKTYSITKAFTAVAIMQLVEEGKVYLSQPIASLFKEFDTELHRRITIWHLLTHTSGLDGDPGVFFEPYEKPWYEWWAHEKKKTSTHWDAGEWMRLLLAGPMRDQPGKQWIYCSAGFGLLGELIAKVSGMPYEQFLDERIFKPLGMDRSFFRVPQSLIAESCTTNPWQDHEVANPRDRAGMPPAGGNGLFSTLMDLWTFGQAMLDGGTFRGERLLGRRTLEMMASNQLKNVPNRCWGANIANFKHGVGWNLGHDDICSPGTFNHEGAGASGLYIDPHEDLVFAYFVPFNGEWKSDAIINPRAIVWSSLR